MKTTLAAALVAAIARAPHVAELDPAPGVGHAQALAPLVGEWQSDTVDGTSARSTCAWTPRRRAVVCDQRIEGPSGTRSAIDVFVADSARGQFVLYVIGPDGGGLSPVPLVIRDRQWIYGGRDRAADGRFYRTVNDFTRSDTYLWRQESSADGTAWTTGTHGRSRRIR